VARSRAAIAAHPHTLPVHAAIQGSAATVLLKERIEIINEPAHGPSILPVAHEGANVQYLIHGQTVGRPLRQTREERLEGYGIALRPHFLFTR
jgi:hypothetical protein